MVKTEGRSLKIVVFLLVGAILSGIVSAMYLTKSINFEQFYDVGNLYDIVGSDYRRAEENWLYNYSTKLVEVKAADTRRFFEIKSIWKDWNYLCLELKNVSQAIPCQIEFCDRGGNVLYTMEQELQNGSNVFPCREEMFMACILSSKSPVRSISAGCSLGRNCRILAGRKL